MKKSWLKRVICGILTGVMVLSYIPTPISAAQTDGLCEHHTQHTEECGYSSAVEGMACNHEHTDACYETATACIHVHGDCGYVAAVEGHSCDCQPNENGVIVHTDGCGFLEAVAEVPCGHVCSEESGCVTKTLNCQHQHDSECGYVEGKQESPCTFVCEECAKEAADNETADAVAASIQALPTVEALQEMTTEQQAEAYEQVQKAYDAYNALTEEQKALLSDSEGIFAPLFDYFNAQTAPAVETVASGTCGPNLTWVIDDNGTLTISGSGEMWDYNEWGTMPWFDVRQNVKALVINNGVSSVGYSAFEDCQNLKEVTLPESLRTVGGYAFQGCSGLKKMTIPEGVIRIEQGAFITCDALESISFPKTLQSIGDDCFQYCSKMLTVDIAPENAYFMSIDGVIFRRSPMELMYYPAGRPETEYTIPDGVVSIESTSFSNCQYLENLKLPEGLQKIKNSAFMFSERINHIEIPSSVTNIEECAFRYAKLVQVDVVAENLQYASADGVLFNKNMTELLYYPHEKSKSAYIVPDGVEEIHLLAFENNEYLVDVTLPFTLSIIGNYAFNQCSNLERIQIPKSMSRIGSYAFQSCESLEEIYFKGNTPQIQRDAFWGVTAKCYYPNTNSSWEGDVFQDYGGDLTWLPYELPLEDLDRSGQLGENLAWALTEDGTLTISGLGEMPNYWNPEDYPWHRLRSEIQKVVVELGVEDIGNDAFAQCDNLRDVTLPNTLHYIKNYAFSACPMLTEIVIPKQVRGIYSGAFQSCTNLTAISFRNQSHCFLAENAFEGVTAEVTTKGYLWSEEQMQDYGGHLTWIDAREPLQKITLSQYTPLTVGTTGYIAFDYYPESAAKELVCHVDAPDILEIVDYSERGCQLNCLRTGNTMLTVTDRKTGISASISLEVKEPDRVIPSGEEYAETFVVEPSDTRYHERIRTYRFTPKQSGLYQLECTYIDSLFTGDTGHASISVFCEGGYVDVFRYQDYSDRASNVFSLEADTDYLIRLVYTTGVKPQKSTFTLKKWEPSEESDTDVLTIYPVSSICLFPGETQTQYLSYCYTGNAPLQWSTDSPDVLRIEEVSLSVVRFTVLRAGTANIYCTGKGIEESVLITAVNATTLWLNQYVYTSLKDSEEKGFVFTAPEDGVYYFGTRESSKSTGFYWNIRSYSSRQYVTESYTDSGKILYCTLKQGDILHLTARAQSFTGTFYVKRADPAYAEIQLKTRDSYADGFSACVSYSPISGTYSPIIDWASSDETICCPNNYYAPNGSCSFSILKEGDVTITAYAANGQTASMTLHVGKCLNGHQYGSWEKSSDNPLDLKNALERKCKNCDSIEYYVLQQHVPGTLNAFEMGLNPGQTLWVDGVPHEVDTAGKIDLDGMDAKTAVLYSYHDGGSGVHSQYPTGMKVWHLKQVDGYYTAEYVPELDNLLQYSGSSIRITGNKGIRMITSVNQDTRNALTGNGLANFKLLEYGTLLAQTSKLGNNPLVLGGANVKSNYAYKKGVADPVFKYTGDLVQYTNVLVGFTDEQCKEDIAMRPYMKLLDENGEEFVIYGGIVYRSIGYIAYQNRNAFQPGSAAYEYVWSIIHNVYGNQYDSEYKK